MRVRLVVLALWALLVVALTSSALNGVVLGGVALISGGYGIMRWSPSSSWPVVPTVRLLWLLPVILGILGPCLAGLTNANLVFDRLAAAAPNGSWLTFGSTCAVVGLAIAAAFFWPRRWHTATFPVAATLVATAAKLAFVSTVWTEPVSDFAGMWRIAGGIAEGGLAAAPDPGNHLQGLHFQRSLLYFVPLHFLFGAYRWAYVIPNCLLTVGSSLLTFWIARKFFGPRAGRVALVLSLLAIEPMLAAGIPTHDNPGTFLTLVAIVAFLAVDRLALERSWRSAVLAAVALGILLTLLDLQRNNRVFLLLAAFLFLAGSAAVELARRPADGRPWRRSMKRAVLCFAVPLLVTISADAGLRATGLLMPRDVGEYWKYRAIAAHTDSWSTGQYRHAVDEYYDLYDLDGRAWRDLAWRKMLTDTVRNPEARAAFMLRKAGHMFDLGSQFNFYVPRTSQLRSGETISRDFRRDLFLVNRTFVLLFLLLLVAGTVSIWFDPGLPPSTFLPALYLGITLAALLVLFQAQPRYAFQIWYLGSIYAAASFRRRSTGSPEPTSH